MKKLVGVILSMSFLLGACGHEERKPAEFGKTISKGEHILLITDSKDKDIKENEKINQVAHVKDGNIRYYKMNSNLRLKGLNDKKDDDLLKLAKKEDKEEFEESKEMFRSSENLLAIKAKRDGKSDEKFIERIDNVDSMSYKSPESHKLNIETVIKNEKTIKESLNMSYGSSSYPLWSISKNIDNEYEKELKKTIEPFFDKQIKAKNIGDERYSGLQSNEHKILMKLKDNQANITFDKETHNNPYISTFNYDKLPKKKS
ncbi:hypothetical protein ACFYSI_12825 [Staphylococcus xylosus]|uniref:hypothetical protein n=1 Tax=Staphylococcus xylosus TaxID=1288 RepID=UPI003680BBD5